jgi:hypothetical protein
MMASPSTLQPESSGGIGGRGSYTTARTIQEFNRDGNERSIRVEFDDSADEQRDCLSINGTSRGNEQQKCYSRAVAQERPKARHRDHP